MDNGDAVLAAIRVIRERLQDAIYFSTSALNLTGGQRIEADRVDAYYQKCQLEHEEWDREYRQAVHDLNGLGYPVPDHWHHASLAAPQIAFSEVPVARYEGGEPIGVTWVIGAGFNPEDRPLPEWVAGKIRPGETIGFDANEEEPDFVAGAFDESTVTEWKQALADVQSREQHVVELKLQWEAASPDRTDKKTDSGEGETGIKVTPDDALKTGRYVREQLAEIKAGRRLKIAKKALIAEFFDQQGWDEGGIPAMQKELQPSRSGWLLDVPVAKKKRTPN